MKMAVIILDNGAGELKAGFANDVSPRWTYPNCVARLKNQAMTLIGDELASQVKDLSQLQVGRPFERGYLVNWNCQIEIWDRLFYSQMRIDPRQSSLLVTVPPFNPEELQTEMDEVVFEDYNFQSYRPVLSAHGAWINRRASGNSWAGCSLIVDSGFSFTHIIPMVGNYVLWESVRRVNIGGKLLTNYLKEIVSYRQWNMMDETMLINEVKESLCYCSLDYLAEVKQNRKCVSGRHVTDIVKEWVLPDYQTIMRGYSRDPQPRVRPSTGTESSQSGEQVLRMGIERISIPEVLFHPSDIGINQKGVAEALVESVQSVPPEYRALMYENILLVGGTSRFPNYEKRLYQELRHHVPAQYKLKMNLPSSPELYSWDGLSNAGNDILLPVETITKSMYMEHGSGRLQQKLRGQAHL